MILFISISVVLSTLCIFGLSHYLFTDHCLIWAGKDLRQQKRDINQWMKPLSGIKLIKLMHKEIFFANKLRKPSFDFAEAMAYMTVVRSLPRHIFEVIVFGLIIILVLITSIKATILKPLSLL